MSLLNVTWRAKKKNTGVTKRIPQTIYLPENEDRKTIRSIQFSLYLSLKKHFLSGEMRKKNQRAKRGTNQAKPCKQTEIAKNGSICKLKTKESQDGSGTSQGHRTNQFLNDMPAIMCMFKVDQKVQ